MQTETLLYKVPRKLEYVKNKFLHLNSVGLCRCYGNAIVIAGWNLLLGYMMLQFVLLLTVATKLQSTSQL